MWERASSQKHSCIELCAYWVLGDVLGRGFCFVGGWVFCFLGGKGKYMKSGHFVLGFFFKGDLVHLGWSKILLFLIYPSILSIVMFVWCFQHRTLPLPPQTHWTISTPIIKSGRQLRQWNTNAGTEWNKNLKIFRECGLTQSQTLKEEPAHRRPWPP